LLIGLREVVETNDNNNNNNNTIICEARNVSKHTESEVQAVAR